MDLLATLIPEYLSRSDRKGVSASILFCALALITFFYVKPPSQKTNTHPIARIENFKNNVRYKQSGNTTFFDAIKNEILQNNDVVFTDANSEAVVRFINSKTALKIPSSSLVKIEQNKKGESVEIISGVVNIVLEKDQVLNLKVQGKNYEISPSENQTNIQAFVSEDQLHLLTNDSSAKVSTDKGEFKLDLNKEASFSESEIKKEPEFILLSPQSSEKIDNIGSFNIKLNKSAKYDLTLSKTTDFHQPFYKTNFEGDRFQWDIDLADGDYFLKIDDGKNIKVITFTLAPKYKIEGLSPADGEEYFLKPGDGVLLKWSSLDTNSYKVIVRDDKEVISEYMARSNSVKLNKVRGKSFEWQVLPELTSGKFLKSSKWNKVGLNFTGKINVLQIPVKTSFMVSNQMQKVAWTGESGEKYKINLTNLSTGIELASEVNESTHIDLPINKNGRYRLEVSSVNYPSLQKIEYTYQVGTPLLIWDSAMDHELKSTDTDSEIELKFESKVTIDNNVELNIEYISKAGEREEKRVKFGHGQKIQLFGFGEYCFKAQFKKSVEFFSDSDEFCLKHFEVPVFTTPARLRNLILKFTKNGNQESYKLDIPKINKSAKYHFEIYHDDKAKNLVYTYESIKPEMIWPTSISGIYYLKYKAIDIKGRESEFSPLSKLIFPISPLSDWEDE